jgi:hypothetical protein
MRFMVYRTSQGSVAREAPCPGAVRGAEAPAWPGEYQWFVELAALDDLVAFLQANGGGLGLFAPEEGEECLVIEIFDDDADADADED